MQDATTPFKFLFLTAVEARNLKNVQMIGKQDPYLKLWVGRAGTKVQTRVDDGAGTSATWGESFKFSVERLHAEEFLYFKVKNKNITDTKTIGSGKVPIKMFGSTMQGKWYKLYDPNGRDAGEILLEGRLSRRGDMNQSMGDPGQNLLNASAERGAPSMGPSAPIAWGAGGARPSTQWHAPMNQSSIASFSSARPSNAAYYSGSGHHHPDLSPGSSSTGTAVPSMPSRWGNGSTSASAASSSFPVHRPSLSLPSAPAQSQFVEQRPNHHSGHPRRASNTGVTTGGIPIAWANRPASATPASSHFPVPTAPPSLPALPAQSGVMGQRSSPYGGPRSYGGSSRLPHGWEEKVASTGRTFYVDHTTKTTSWVRPGEASHGVSR